MSGPLVLKPQGVEIDAPRELVFQMLTSFRRGRIAGDYSERRLKQERPAATYSGVSLRSRKPSFTLVSLRVLRGCTNPITSVMLPQADTT